MLYQNKWKLTPLKLLIILLSSWVINTNAAFLPVFTGTPSIDGTALVGNTLTIIDTGTSDDDVGDIVTLSYQWLANDVPISGAISDSYILTINEAHAIITANVTADDNNDGPVTVTTAAVTVTNSAPTISGIPAISVLEDSGYSFTPLADDIDGDSLTFSINIQPGWSSFDTATGTLSGIPVNSDVGITNGIVITVTDGTLDSASLPAFNLQVINTNDAPTITSTAVTTASENIAYTYTFTASDVDVGDALTLSAPVLPTWLGFNATTGELSGTPGNAEVGSHAVTLRVNDGTVDVDQSFTIAVANANDPPIITSTAITTATEDIAYTYTLIASDVDVGDLLTHSAPVLPAWLSFNTTTHVLSGTPSNANVGIHSVTLRVNDGTVDVDQSFSITVANVNDAPTINGAPITSINEDSIYSFTPIANDVDVGDTLTFSIANQPGWASFDSATGELSGTPGNSDVGITNAILITVTDDSLASSSLPPFNIEVINTNDAPFITSTEVVLATEDVAYTYTFSATDVDVGDVLTYSAPVLPSWLSFNTTTGVLSGTPVNADIGSHPVTLRVNDGTVDVDQSFNITVANVNNPPTISGTPITSVAEDSSYSFTPVADDIDVGDILSFSITNQPVWASFDSATGTLSGIPTNSAVGTTSGIVITVTDSALASASLPAFNLQVTNTNDAPIITSTAVIVATEDEIYSYAFVATDEDIDDTLTYSVASVLPSWLNFNASTGVLTGTPGNADIGSYPVTLRASDGAIDVDQSFTITVANANDAPTITSIAVTTATEDNAYTYTITAIDVDVGDVLTYSAPVLPVWLSFNTTTHVLTGTPANANVGSHPVTLRVTDGTVNVDQSFTIVVSNTNDAPTISSTAVTTATENIAYTYTFTASDVDIGDALTLSAPVLPTWLGFNTTTGELSGTPGNADVGAHAVTLRVNDGTVDVDQSFIITVDNINDPPTIISTAVTTATEDIAYTYTIIATDIDTGDTLAYSAPVLPTWLNFNTTTGVLSGTPDNDNVGSHPVTLRVNDGSVDIDQSFNIDVSNVNDPPTISGIPGTLVAEGSPYSFTPTANDVDVDNTLVFSINTIPTWASFDTLTGTLSGTPGNSDVGSTNSIVITVTDSSLASASLPAFNLLVSNTNNAPTITGIPATSVNEDSSYNFTPTANDIDEGDTLSFSISNQPAWASFDPSTGTLSGTPTNSHVGITNNIVITVTDGSSVSASLTAFNLQVINTNDTPIITSTAVTIAVQNTIYNYTFTATDEDVGDVLTLSAPVLPSWLNFNTSTGVLSGTPLNADVGNHPVTLRVSDGSVDIDQSFIIGVGNANDPPTITSTAVTTATEDIAYTYTFTATDIDTGDTLTYSAPVLPAWLNFNTTTGVLSGIPVNANVGNHPVTLRVNDGGINTDQNFTITVSNVNDAPTITSTAITTATQNAAYNYNFTATDVDVGDVLTLSAPVLPGWLSFNTSTGVLNGTPLNADVGNHPVTLRVNDGSINVDQDFIIIVGNANDAPVITGTPVTRAVEGLTYNFLPSATDEDTGDSLTFVISNMPTWAIFDPVSGSLTGTPTAANIGTTSGIIIGVNDGTVTVNLPAFNITVVGDLDGDTIGDDVDSDIDGDGMPNTFETDNGLDPRNPADASLDSDGDGVSNLDEYLRGTNPGMDEVPPLVIAPAGITMNATGRYTRIDFGLATAVDARDGVLPVTPDLGDHLSSGTHVLTWSATDAAGNTGTATQIINIIPMVVFNIDQLSVEGNVASVKVILNGPAVSYPVIVPYTVSGTATLGADHNLVDGNITLNTGSVAQLHFNIVNDGPGDADETIIISMGTPTNAVMGSRHVHKIKIAEGNITPQAILSADQGQGTTRIINQANGIVTVTANVIDPNSADIHSFDWSASENALVDIDATANTFSFDPATLAPGYYTLRVTVNDGIENDDAELAIHIVASTPVLTTDDSDGDGIDDVTEGYGDSDNDGVPNYLDAIAEQNVLQGQSASSEQHLIETESGLNLALGLVAFQANPGQAIVTPTDIVNYSHSPADELPNTGGLFDFVLTDLSEAGQSVHIVLPLLAPIPVDASYRKLMPTGWQDFVEDDRNSLSSAPGTQAYCPPPGDNAYTSGLTNGHWCVQLFIEDGGPNDADQRANKRIADPGGLVQLNNITVNVSSSGGAIYAPLLLLLLWPLLLIFRERKL